MMMVVVVMVVVVWVLLLLLVTYVCNNINCRTHLTIQMPQVCM
jgi:hypothetical protein